MRLLQRPDEFIAEQGEIALDPARAADKDMVGPGDAKRRQLLAGQRAEASLKAIANDCAADLLGHGKADAHGRIPVFTPAHLQDETRHGDTLAAVGGEEVCPFA